MKIADIKPGMNNVTVTGRIVNIGEKKLVTTRFGDAYVAQALLEDHTGKIILNLWRGQIEMVKIGDIVTVENGFVGGFKKQLELNVGSKGRIMKM